jgi:hypothetical protein
MRRKASQSLTRQLIKARTAVLPQVCGDFLAHALGPKLGDVIGDAGDGVLALRFRAKEVADVIRHLYKVGCAAISFAVRRGER